MTDYSTIDVEGTTLTFRGDKRYSLTWGLYRAVSLAYPGGEGALGSGGHSMTEIDVSGILVTNMGGDGSADKQLHSILLPILRDTQRTKIPATVTLQLGNGPVIYDGWIRNFLADRDAPEGEEIITITFNMLFRIPPDHSGLS